MLFSDLFANTNSEDQSANSNGDSQPANTLVQASGGEGINPRPLFDP